jgi:hypothetical protein
LKLLTNILLEKEKLIPIQYTDDQNCENLLKDIENYIEESGKEANNDNGVSNLFQSYCDDPNFIDNNTCNTSNTSNTSNYTSNTSNNTSNTSINISNTSNKILLTGSTGFLGNQLYFHNF